MLVDLVSRGGNLCLDIGPASDGSIPVIMQERLHQIGQWLKINGESIYGTRMRENDCQWSGGERPETKRGEYMSGFDILKYTVDPDPGMAVKEIFFTVKGDKVFAITPKWPGAQLAIESLAGDFEPGQIPKVTFLLTGKELNCRWSDGDLIIEMPEFDPELFGGQAAFVFEIGR